MKKSVFFSSSFLIILSLLILLTPAAAAADIESELIGYYKFDGDFKNQVGGEAEAIGQNFNDAFDEPVFELGYCDHSVYVDSSIGDGFVLDAVPDGNEYTISFWAKAESCGFAAPIIWIGSETHTDASYSAWLGIWADFDGSSWENAPTLGSNDEENSKVGAIPDAGLSNAGQSEFDWTYITLVVDGGYGTLYFNGTESANTVDQFSRSLIPSYAGGSSEELPSMFGSDGYRDSKIYVAVNAWDAPSSMYYDEMRVYGRALSSDDVAALYASFDGHTPSSSDPDYNPDTEMLPADTEPEETVAEGTDAPETVEAPLTDAVTDDTGTSGIQPWVYIVFGTVWAGLIAAIIAVIIKRKKS